MLTSLALIFLVGMTLGWVFSRLRLPSLLGGKVFHVRQGEIG